MSKVSETAPHIVACGTEGLAVYSVVYTTLIIPISLVTSNVATGLASDSLLMTCRVLIHSPNGSVMKVRAILDSASSASFISERLTHLLEFPHTRRNVRISGVAGLSHGTLSHSVVQFALLPVQSPTDKSQVSAIVIPRVTCDLPVKPVTPKLSWDHLSDIPLADPDFGRPGRIDLFLEVDIFVTSLLHGRRVGSPGSPTALETIFGWVLAGLVESQGHRRHVTTHHAFATTGDDLLHKFWEIEETPGNHILCSLEEQTVLSHFKENHHRNEAGRFVVPLPKKSNAPSLGESRSQAVRKVSLS